MQVSEAGRSALAKCREILGGKADPFAVEWSAMPRTERRFWLHYARLGAALADKFYGELSDEHKRMIKQAVKKAGQRSQCLLNEAAQ